MGGISGEKGAHPRKVLCLRSSEGNLFSEQCSPSPPTPTTPAQIKGSNRHQISGLRLSLGNHWTNCPPLAAHTPTKYCRDIFHLHHLSLTIPKTVNLVKRSSLAFFGTLGSLSLQNVEFKIMWEEPLDVRKFIHTKYCAWNYLRGTPSYPYPK